MSQPKPSPGPPPSPRRLLLLSKTSSYRAGAFAEAARRLGVEIVYGVDAPPPLAAQWKKTLGLPFAEPEEAVRQMVAFARRKPVQAILAADDSATVLAAMAAEALGLPHNEVRAAQAARNKYQMRRLFAAAGVPCPPFQRHPLDADLAAVCDAVPYPCVVKPLNLSGSRGVIRADDPVQFEAAFRRAAALVRRSGAPPEEAYLLVEGFIPGVEVALEGLLDDGQLTVLALFDKPDPLDGPFFEETLYVTPSRLPAAAQTAIADCTARAVAALGLRHGPIHAELRLNEAGPWMLEVAARSIGGLCARTLRFADEISLEELIIRQALGMEMGNIARPSRAEGVMMIPIPEAGLLEGVSGVAEAEAVPGVTEVEITAPLHYPLVPLP
ncbi:MAG: ATP-grasp domain-containing protein, partial [Caldilineae bacterium]